MQERRAPLPAAAADVEHLLRPTLAAAPLRRPLYSVRAGFFVAFFGGVYATIGFSALNSSRAGRLAKDLWIYLLVAAAWSALMIAVGYGIAADNLPGWLDVAGKPGRTVRFAGRGLALAVFGMVYLRHRPLIKAQELLGDEPPPNPWPAGLLTAVAAMVLTLLFGWIGAALGMR